MGGDIWVESEQGAGAAFRFTATFGLQQAAPPVATGSRIRLRISGRRGWP